MRDHIESPLAIQPPFVRRIADGIELKLKVVPGASRSQLAGTLGERLKVRVAAVPEQGKANRVVLSLLRDWLKVPGIEIVAGHGCPEKTVRVPGLLGLTAKQLTKMRG